MTGDSPHWILYTLTAIGFLAMIFLSESEQIARWGPILAEDHGHSEPKPLAVPTWPRTGARAIGGVATALSIVVPGPDPDVQRAPVRLRAGHRW